MKRWFLLLLLSLFIESCDDAANVEIYNENNTSVVNGVVYDIDENPINGLYKIYYPNGVVRMEVDSKSGKPDGEGKFYTEDGTLQYSGTFKAGVMDGVLYNYYPDGHIRNELHYVNGVLDGEQKTFDEQGNMTVYAVFANGKAESGYAVIDEKKVELSGEELKNLE